MKEYLKPALILLVLCFITVGAVAAVHDITRDRIETLALKTKQENMQAVLPDADSFESEFLNLSDVQYKVTIQEINTGYKNGSVTGYVYVVKTAGYGGDITVMIGIDQSGAVSGVIMGENNETPGLGKNAAKPGFADQFIGAREPKLKIVKSGGMAENEIDSVSGATYTSNAMIRAVNAVLGHFTKEEV